ncbi:MAG: adenylate/guanylate cyclase domain-containing protein [Gemmatimonadota bacterium]
MTARQRRTLLSLSTGLAVALALIALRGTYLLESIELKTLDARFRALSDPADADSNIVIIDVDNLSLDLTRNTLGRFPWQREVWAMVTDFVTAGGARAIAFDFMFAEPDWTDPGSDGAFVEAAARAGTLVQSLSFQRITDTTQVLAQFREDSVAIDLLLTRFSTQIEALPENLNRFQAVQHPFPALLAAARNVGAVNLTPDAVDGTTRRVPLLYQFRNSALVTFGLATAMVADSMQLRSCPRWTWSAGQLVLCDTTVPVNDDGEVLIKWHGPYRDVEQRRETYRVIPIAQVFRSYEQTRSGRTPELELESFRNKIVFIGGSGSGLFEPRANPFGPADPGVLIHATLTDNIVNRDFLRRAPAALNVTLIVIAALSVALAVSAISSVWLSAAFAIGLAALYVGGTFWSFAAWNLWLDAATPALGIIFTFTGVMAINYVTEGRQKRQIREMFSKYVAPEYVAQLAEDPARLHLEGRRAELSILFSDIRGFTSISEKLEPPEVIAFLNQYLDAMAEIVKQSGGTLDKFVGDAVMAFWGEPIERADHAVRACDCALAMQAGTLALAERFVKEGKPNIRVGIGVNTADVVVGNIGSLKHKLDYTVIGDGVNLASRLEGLNKDFATTIIISEFTLAHVGNRFATRPLGAVNVKGKSEPVHIYELLGRNT